MSALTRDERRGNQVAYANAVVNVLLAVGKGIVGVLAGSEALVADAVHSAADLIGSLAVIIGLRIARKPPDEDHPYGHGKAELIASIIVAGFLVAAAVEVGYTSATSLFHKPTRPDSIAAYTAFAAMLVKECLYHFNIRLGRRLHSKSLIASAYDHRSDVYSSMAAFIGIGLSLLGSHLHIHVLLYMDSVAGIFVAILVLKMAIEIAKDSLQSLMDRVVLEEQDLAPYMEAVQSVQGVRCIDEIRVRDHGQYVIVDLEIGVDAHITVAAGHDIAARVRSEMRAEFDRIQDVFVHVNPYYSEEERKDERADTNPALADR
ncbi:cation diffusion facilitator family transporter [Alicyclobacillus fastidiosus]|uniref:Cation diffusion facilitator family transporter n=1 Tax=Alicyclobacillus fastidiosus TaxID=392011 RepID=A0ABV5ACZ7_9BACL|nr:cation diffusion facilitator family transporter [Alicyclobacillus fastidiosus]WEH11214.1 cation diffusion facilitator family transporter [Alicyclobacillus fastidiosus]